MPVRIVGDLVERTKIIFSFSSEVRGYLFNDLGGNKKSKSNRMDGKNKFHAFISSLEWIAEATLNEMDQDEFWRADYRAPAGSDRVKEYSAEEVKAQISNATSQAMMLAESLRSMDYIVGGRLDELLAVGAADQQMYFVKSMFQPMRHLRAICEAITDIENKLIAANALSRADMYKAGPRTIHEFAFTARAAYLYLERLGEEPNKTGAFYRAIKTAEEVINDEAARLGLKGRLKIGGRTFEDAIAYAIKNGMFNPVVRDAGESLLPSMRGVSQSNSDDCGGR